MNIPNSPTSVANRNRGRVLVCKVGLDGHDRGAKLLVRILNDEGFDVSYLGVRATAEAVGEAALANNVDVVAVSLLSGAHLSAARNVRKALDKRDLAHIPLAFGGLIPQRDASALSDAGVARCFCTGAPDNSPTRIPAAIDELVSQSRRLGAEEVQC